MKYITPEALLLIRVKEISRVRNQDVDIFNIVIRLKKKPSFRRDI